MATRIVPQTETKPNSILSPIVMNASAPDDFATDIEIMLADRAALEELAQSILANKRLAWIIVSAWLRQNGRLLVDGKVQ